LIVNASVIKKKQKQKQKQKKNIKGSKVKYYE